jgi:hypothetical protein
MIDEEFDGPFSRSVSYFTPFPPSHRAPKHFCQDSPNNECFVCKNEDRGNQIRRTCFMRDLWNSASSGRALEGESRRVECLRKNNCLNILNNLLLIFPPIARRPYIDFPYLCLCFPTPRSPSTWDACKSLLWVWWLNSLCIFTSLGTQYIEGGLTMNVDASDSLFHLVRVQLAHVAPAVFRLHLLDM